MHDQEVGKIKEKIYAYCAYQERSEFEVMQKLAELGLSVEESDKMLAHLKQDNFVNNRRFAFAFVGGKFRIKKWGRLKIKSALKQFGIEASLIAQAMDQEIEEEQYLETLTDLAIKKNESIRDKDAVQKKAKLVRYLAAKGYESELIWEVVNQLA